MVTDVRLDNIDPASGYSGPAKARGLSDIQFPRGLITSDANKLILEAFITVSAYRLPDSCKWNQLRIKFNSSAGWNGDYKLAVLSEGKTSIVLPAGRGSTTYDDPVSFELYDTYSDQCAGGDFHVTVWTTIPPGTGIYTDPHPQDQLLVGEKVNVFGWGFSPLGGPLTVKWGTKTIKTFVGAAAFYFSYVITDYPDANRTKKTCTGVLSATQGKYVAQLQLTGMPDYYTYFASGVLKPNGTPVKTGELVCKGITSGDPVFLTPHVFVYHPSPGDLGTGVRVDSTYGPTQIAGLRFGKTGGLLLTTVAGQAKTKIVPIPQIGPSRISATWFNTAGSANLVTLPNANYPPYLFGTATNGRLASDAKRPPQSENSTAPYTSSSSIIKPNNVDPSILTPYLANNPLGVVFAASAQTKSDDATFYASTSVAFLGGLYGYGRFATPGKMVVAGESYWHPLDWDEKMWPSLVADGDIVLP